MPKIKVKSVDQLSRKPVSYAHAAFMRHCLLKNLAPYSYLYYNKNIQYFLDTENEIKYVDEICPEVIERFIGKLMDRVNKVTAINARLRAVFVFLRYCFDQEYLEAFPISLIKEDETLKEPYTEAELQKLLKQPETSYWAEWRTWAVINLLVATGVRAICISDEYLELDILAHEITHAELRARLTARAQGKVPTWFDEGLALQNDYRERYSEEQWISQTGNGKNVIASEDMDTPAEFYAGEAEDRRFRYLNAKHELDRWMAVHGQQGLLELIEKLNNGEDFDMAYGS